MMGGKIIYNNSPAEIAKRIEKAAAAGLKEAVEFWHSEMLPEHFTPAGGKKYKYQPRRGDLEPMRLPVKRVLKDGTVVDRTLANWHYSWRKRRKKRHNKPLVWSGRSEAAAKSSVRIAARKKTADGSTIEGSAAMNLPQYFYQYRKDHGAPDKADELTRATPAEEQRLSAIIEKRVTKELARASATGRVKKV